MINFRKIKTVKDLLIHPNFLTLVRIASAPAIVILLSVSSGKICSSIAALLFSIAAITDYLDGYFARLQGTSSTFGKVMDPLADKILVSSSLIMLTSLGWSPAWMVCVIITREIIITGLRSLMVEHKENAEASLLGKYKTGFQIAAIIPLFINYKYCNIDFHAVGMFFLFWAMILTIWSGFDYLFKFKKLFR